MKLLPIISLTNSYSWPTDRSINQSCGNVRGEGRVGTSPSLPYTQRILVLQQIGGHGVAFGHVVATYVDGFQSCGPLFTSHAGYKIFIKTFYSVNK